MEERNIFILDQETGQRLGALLRSILASESRYNVELVERSVPENSRPHLVMPVLPAATEQAEDLLANLRTPPRGAPLLPVVPADALSPLMEALAAAGTDFLLTPLREPEVHARVRRMLPARADSAQPAGTDGELAARGLAQLIGEDPVFASVRRKISMAARSESTILLTGETGTGKERCARALHYCSPRAGKPFLPVNCGAIPLELFENELFGHHSGAFTGASSAQPGLIAEAEGGTLFLDEIETLSLACQVKLLRFLQDQTYFSLGSAKPRQANVWIIASTNVDLLERARAGSFREDLFYRLAVINLKLPPLRERIADIPLLANHFLRLYGGRFGQDGRHFSPGAAEALSRYPWPGNVRELENTVQQVLVLTESQTVEAEDLPLSLPAASSGGEGGSFRQTKAGVLAQFERSYLSGMLRAHEGNVTHAAKAAGMERRAFGRLIKKHRLSR